MCSCVLCGVCLYGAVNNRTAPRFEPFTAHQLSTSSSLIAERKS